jgi:hypothetical protein
MAVLGLIGDPLLCAAGIAVLFNVIEPASMAQNIATVPEFIWELSLGIYLLVKGFKPSAITTGMVATDGASAHQQVAGERLELGR